MSTHEKTQVTPEDEDLNSKSRHTSSEPLAEEGKDVSGESRHTSSEPAN